MSEMIDNTVMEDDLEYISENTMDGKYLVFLLDTQEFAIAIKYVVDIINIQPLTRVPNVPAFVKGITNLRGQVIPIIDVRLRFGKEAQEYNDRTCIIVVEVGELSVGMIIDQVLEVITLDDDHISPPPAFNQSAEAPFIQGIGQHNGQVKLILNCHSVLDEELLPEDEQNDLDE